MATHARPKATSPSERRACVPSPPARGKERRSVMMASRASKTCAWRSARHQAGSRHATGTDASPATSSVAQQPSVSTKQVQVGNGRIAGWSWRAVGMMGMRPGCRARATLTGGPAKGDAPQDLARRLGGVSCSLQAHLDDSPFSQPLLRSCRAARQGAGGANGRRAPRSAAMRAGRWRPPLQALRVLRAG